MKFYSLYSKSLGRYNPPFLAEDDSEAIQIVSKMVASQGDLAFIMSLDDVRLDEVGSFNPGEAFPVCGDEAVCTILDWLHTDLPLPPTVKERTDAFYNFKAQHQQARAAAEAAKQAQVEGYALTKEQING